MYPDKKYSKSRADLRRGGFSLIEMIVFIVIVSIAARTLLVSFASSLPRATTPQQVTIATHLAQERLELIMAQKAVTGYSNMTDPCSAGAPTACSALPGYTVSVSGVPAAAIAACPAAIDNNTTTCRTISVSVTGPNGNQLVSLTTLVTNYQL